MRACKAKAIYFEHGVRRVDYLKCRGCLNCVQVCPRNAIEVTSITQPHQIVTIKVDHEKCSMCEACLNEGFCPNDLFYKGLVKTAENEVLGIRYKYEQIAKCQGCLKCELSCPEGAIKPITYEAQNSSK